MYAMRMNASKEVTDPRRLPHLSLSWASFDLKSRDLSFSFSSGVRGDVPQLIDTLLKIDLAFRRH